MKRLLIALTLLVVVSIGTPLTAQPAAARAPHSHPAFLDKTRFVLHMGAAYYAFHHFVWKRYQDGSFKSGASHRTLNLIKAGIALLFAYHEVHVSYDIAKKSNSKLLHALVSPLDKLGAAFSAIGAKFKKGQYSDSDLTGLNSQAGSLQSLAGSSGFGFKDRTVPVPGA